MNVTADEQMKRTANTEFLLYIRMAVESRYNLASESGELDKTDTRDARSWGIERKERFK
jgi:hypothetical protein